MGQINSTPCYRDSRDGLLQFRLSLSSTEAPVPGVKALRAATAAAVATPLAVTAMGEEV
jgi:hypothetical protein